MKTRIRQYPAEELLWAVSQFALPADVVLDVGCGIKPEPIIRPGLMHILVEPCEEYIGILRARYGNDAHYLILHARADVMALLPDHSIDTVVMIDLIEHLPKTEGKDVLNEANRVAKSQIIVGAPLGWVEQTVDGWGYQNDSLQTHCSEWTPIDFDEHWSVLVCPTYSLLNNCNTADREKPVGVMYAIKTLGQPPTPQGEYISKKSSSGRLAAHLQAILRMVRRD